MNDAAYDISHLLELEATAPAMPGFRSAKPVIVKTGPSGMAAAQEALARELLQMADRHEDLIQQYLRMKDDSVPDTNW
ncbi:MAG: hypothetical protein ABI767_15690 [Rhodanobacter sp.]